MSHKSSLGALCMIMALVIAATGCGGSGDDDRPAAPPAPPSANAGTPYDGTYVAKLTAAAARMIPEPSITLGTYQLVLGEGNYAIFSDRGPFGGGRLTGSSGRLRFGLNRDSACTPATGSYTATLERGALRLRALDDACEDRRDFLERSWRRR